MSNKTSKIFVRLLISLSFISHCAGAPREFAIDPAFSEVLTELLDTAVPLERTPENLDGPNFGPRLYSTDILKPTCLAHGVLRDTRKNLTEQPSAAYISYNNWINESVELHNVYRGILGYRPVLLSDNLTRISQAYALAMDNPDAGQTILEFEVSMANNTDPTQDWDQLKSANAPYLELDLLYEEVYLRDNVGLEAPDTNGFLTLGCCPGPFVQEISPDSEEIGIARFVQQSMGNFRRIVVVASFYPKSIHWAKTGLCQPMNDSMEGGTESSYDENENAGYDNTENVLFGDFDTQEDPDEDTDAAEQERLLNEPDF